MKKLSTLLQATTLVLVAGICAVAGTTYAQSQPGQTLVQAEALPMDAVRAARFHFLDTNRDGFLIRDDIPGDDVVMQSQFGALDRNGDGRLTLEEYAIYGKLPR